MVAIVVAGGCGSSGGGQGGAAPGIRAAATPPVTGGAVRADLAPADDDPRDVARAIATKLAYEAYPPWAMRPANAGRCPTVAELVEYLPDPAMAIDPWGEGYRVQCEPGLPAGVRGIAVSSAGADRRPATADDVRSWDE